MKEGCCLKIFERLKFSSRHSVFPSRGQPPRELSKFRRGSVFRKSMGTEMENLAWINSSYTKMILLNTCVSANPKESLGQFERHNVIIHNIAGQNSPSLFNDLILNYRFLADLPISIIVNCLVEETSTRKFCDIFAWISFRVDPIGDPRGF